MKTPINPITSKLSPFSRIKILTLAAALTLPAATGLAQSFWSGGSNDFNNASYWSGTFNYTPPLASGLAADVNNEGSNDVVLIQPGDPVWNHAGLIAGSLANTSGAYLQTGSTNNAGSNPGTTYNLRLGELAGAHGSYVLSNGMVNVTGYTSVGEAGAGYLEVDGGVYNAGIVSDPGICAGYGDINGAGGTGTMVITGGTVNNPQESWFGEEYGSSTGYFIMSGGVFNANNWFVLGRNGGVGYGVVSGGTINFTGGGQFLVGGGGNGTLIQSGGTINVYNQYLVPQSGNTTTDVGTNILSGTAVLNVHDWLAVGRNSGSGLLVVSNGASITRDNANDGGANFDVGASGNGILNQDGGNITNLAGNTYIAESGVGTWNLNSGVASLGNVVFGVNGGANGTMNLNGGTLQASGISVGNKTAVTTFNFNGGTLQAAGNSANFLSGLTLAFSGPGPAVIDSQSYNITIGQEIDDNGGGLVKFGSGTLNLTGPNTYSGSTVVSNGTLVVDTGSSVSGNYAANDNTTFGILVQTANGQLDAQQNVTLGNSAGMSLDFNLGAFGNPASAPLNVGGTVTANGTITINIADTFPQLGQFPLIQSGSPIAGSGNFVLGSLPTGVAASLVVTATTVSLNITGINLPVWAGLAGGTWDTGTDTNWVNLGTGLPTTFANGNVVLFNDSAPGSTAVNLTTTVSPGSTTVNNTNLSYTFYGSGSISGSGGLTKEGANSLAILNPAGNSYTGPTVIAGGSLIVSNLANGGSPSAIGSSSASSTNLVLAGGTLDYVGPAASINRGYTAADTNGAIDIITTSNLTLSGTVTDVSGSGFTVSGPGQLAYANTGLNTLSDILGYSVDEGTVVFSSSGTYDISGSFDIGSSSAIASVVDITNTATVNLLTGGDLDVADSHANGTTNYGTINQSGGVLNVPGGYQTWIGNNADGMGVYNLSGGTFNANNWVAIGRLNGTGTFNLSGSGALHIINGNGGNLDIGTSAGVGGAVGTGVLNQTGGTITNTASQTWLGEGTAGQPASGTWNMSGGTAQLGEVHLGVGGTGTSTLNISGSASITESYLLLANYDTNTTGNVNVGSVSQPGGTITVNADMNVGGAGFGTLNFVTNGGGMVTVTGTLYLSRFDPTADGTIDLNAGGTLVVGFINNGWAFNEGTNSPTFNPNAFNFNGGTLRAFVGSGNFIQPNVNAVVQSGGAIIDDGGYSVSANCTFNDAPGSTAGLTKLGSGTLNLTATNTYTGTTVVSNGTLVANSLAGGITVESGATLLSAGTVSGPVTVASGGTLGGNAGIGTENFNNTLSLASGSTTFAEITPSSNDQIAGLTGVTYGGSLIVSNISSSPLTVNSQYKLFNSSSPGSGNFTSVTLLPVGTATFNPSTGILTITSAGTGPTFNQPYLSSGNLVLTATGGTPGGNLVLLSSTNLLTPLPNWVTNYTGVYDSNGNFSNNIPVSTANKDMFFILKP
jgi:autotransporter-associated beta strand protein